MDALGGGGGMDVPSMPEPNMGNQDMQDPNLDNNMMGGDEQDQGFDAGVDANADSDPKKYIQQLVGKLSQELRMYNNDQENPDEDLNKYVAGMIIPQASKGMTDKGKKEVINKIKKGVTDDEDIDMGDEEQAPSGGEMQMESTINEIINNVLEDDDFTKDRREKKICNKTLPKKNPFRSNR